MSCRSPTGNGRVLVACGRGTSRVLRPDGRLILVDHVGSSVPPVLWLQKAIEVASVRIDGDHMTRRPSATVERHGFDIAERERFRWGIVERLTATPSA